MTPPLTLLLYAVVHRPNQVEGCTVDVSHESSYCRQKRVCTEHRQADSVRLAGSDELVRFCQQVSEYCWKVRSSAKTDCSVLFRPCMRVRYPSFPTAVSPAAVGAEWVECSSRMHVT